MKNILVQGASRGIGLAMVKQLLTKQGVRVFATSRAPHTNEELKALSEHNREELQLIPMDITNEESIKNAFERVGQDVSALHGVYNITGFLHDDALMPARRLEQVSAEGLQKYFAVNSTGPLLVAKYALPLLRHEERAVFASLSARVGSISDNRLGGWYGYRASKAAQNMFTKNLSIELARRAPNTVCIALHPGTVDTGLSKPFQRNVPAERLFSAERAAKQLLFIIDSVTPEETGRFFAWDRTNIEW